MTTEYYVNDVGKQVVLLAWGLANIPSSEVPQVESEKMDHRLVVYYQKANEMMEKDPVVGQQVGEMLRRFEAGDEEVIEQVRKTAKMMLKGMIESLKAIMVDIDQFTWESQFIKDGSARSVVQRLRESEHCKTEGEACYLDLEKFGIHGRDTKFFFTQCGRYHFVHHKGHVLPHEQVRAGRSRHKYIG